MVRGAFCKIVPPQINPLGSRVEWSGVEMAVITLVETTRWAVRYCLHRAGKGLLVASVIEFGLFNATWLFIFINLTVTRIRF